MKKEPPLPRVIVAGPVERKKIMEEGETLMRAGDVLIQRGTAHAWSNRSNDFARICFVLIDGKRAG
jgi:hypothetical protein